MPTLEAKQREQSELRDGLEASWKARTKGRAARRRLDGGWRRQRRPEWRDSVTSPPGPSITRQINGEVRRGLHRQHLTSGANEDVTRNGGTLQRYPHSAHVCVSAGPALSGPTKGGAALCNRRRSVHIKQRNILNPGSF